MEIRTAEVKLKLKKPNINSENPNSEIKNYLRKRLHDEERGLCYGVKRRKESRSGTSQNPQTPTPNLTPTKNNKSHVL